MTHRGKMNSVVIASSGTDSEAIPLHGRRLLSLGFPTMTSGTISFKTKVTSDDASTLLYDENGILVTLGPATTGARSIAHIPELAAQHEVIVVSSAAQGAERTIEYAMAE